MTFHRLSCLFLACLAITACQRANDPEISTGIPFDLLESPVGDVSFPVGCEAEAAALVERGVALMHHMMYDEARFVFSMADDRDPECAMAYWGQAMVLIHPLWPDVPSATVFEDGNEFVRRSLEIGGHSPREDAYLHTARAYFEDTEQLTEQQRLSRFEEAWRKVSEEYPEDLEARAFYSLALRATANPSDKEYRVQRRAGQLSESVLTENPEHPGAHHYLIHSYDFPELAPMALEAADRYGAMTPAVPHATHMMTHIYTRLGLWDKAVEWNTVSADTAWQICIQTGEINLHYTHALDYLAYAYLQMSDDQAAMEILQTAEQLQPPYAVTNRAASAYALAALPARLALERHDWQAATELQPRQPASFPWEPTYDAFVAITHFARAIGLARSGRPDEASEDIRILGELSNSIDDSSHYWAQQVKIQQEAARGWQAYASGNTESGLRAMKRAASMEAATEKEAVTPGEVLPAAELYGDMLIDSGEFAEALEAYESALARSPRRYNSLLGAARAARSMGDDATAERYYSELLDVTSSTTTARSGTSEARDFVGST